MDLNDSTQSESENCLCARFVHVNCNIITT